MAPGAVFAVSGPTRYVTVRCLSLLFPHCIPQFSTDAISDTRTPVRAVQFITICCVKVTVCAADWHCVTVRVCAADWHCVKVTVCAADWPCVNVTVCAADWHSVRPSVNLHTLSHSAQTQYSRFANRILVLSRKCPDQLPLF